MVEITAMFRTDFWVCGLAPFGTDLIVLAVTNPIRQDTGDRAERERPELRVISRTGGRFELESSDALSVTGWEHYNPADYMLLSVPINAGTGPQGGKPLFFIVSPKDIVVARPRDADDRIEWLMAHERLEEALVVARAAQSELKKVPLEVIGEKLLAHLMQVGDFERAAHWCPTLLGEDKRRWTNVVFRFAELRKVDVIAQYIPLRKPALSSTVYDMVLTFYLQDNPERFLQTVRQWRQGGLDYQTPLFSVQSVVAATLERLQGAGPEEKPVLQNALGELYMAAGQFDQALHVFLGLKQGRDVFELIIRHELFGAIREKVLMLVQFDEEQAVELLINNTARIPVEAVVTQLQSAPVLQLKFLHALFLKDPMLTSSFHDLQVKLYAELDPENLAPLLHSSHEYNFEAAHKVCRDHGRFKEVVFLTARMGNAREALELILTEMKDIEEAIRFVQEQKDDDLWELIIAHSVSKPEHVGKVLDMLARMGIIDPVRLINQIPEGMQIPELKQKLLAIIQSHKGMEAINESCCRMLDSEAAAFEQKFVSARTRGRRIASSRSGKAEECKICQLPLEETVRIPGSKATPHSGLIVFWNGNGYHKECLPLPSSLPPSYEGAKMLAQQQLSLKDPNQSQAPRASLFD